MCTQNCKQISILNSFANEDDAFQLNVLTATWRCTRPYISYFYTQFELNRIHTDNRSYKQHEIRFVDENGTWRYAGIQIVRMN